MINTTYEDICDIDNLYQSYLNIIKSSHWKEETQIYGLNIISNLSKLSKSLADFTYRPSKPRGFFISERGKPRYIESRNVQDKIVQNILHELVILPGIQNKLIYDNSASIKNRGVIHFRSRLEYHLSQYSSIHGNNGYVLLMDFRKFFDNIWYDTFLNLLQPNVYDIRCFNLIKQIVYSGAVDVSYMSDEEYANCMHVPFDNLKYRLAVNSGEIKCTGEKFMYKGMGIGSHISQDAGILVPTPIDNYVKIVKGVKYYGRYMDDSYIIHESKEFLLELLNDIKQICYNLGIILNEDKTCIVNLKHEFTTLQTRYKLYDNSKIKIMPNNDTFTRERRKLKKQSKLVEQEDCKLTMKDVANEYKSWVGNILVNTDGKRVEGINKMDKYYDDLFNYDLCL